MSTRLTPRNVLTRRLGFAAASIFAVGTAAGCAAILGFEDTTLRTGEAEGGTVEAGSTEDGPVEQDAAPSRLTASPSSIVVRRGGSADLKVDIARGPEVTGPVTARLSDLPAGVTATTATLDPPSTSGTIKVSAAVSSSLGPKTVKLFAEGTSFPAVDIPLLVSDAPGSLDVTFDADGFLSDATRGVTAAFLAVKVLPDQSIVAGGGAGLGPGLPGPAYQGWIVRRYSASGVADSAFNAASAAVPMPADGEIHAMAVDAAGNVVCVGVSQPAPQQQLTIVRIGPKGAIDKTFGAPSGIVRLPVEVAGSSFGFGVAIQPDGAVVVVGSRRDPLGNNEAGIITRFKADGTRDTTFNGGATVVVPNTRFVGVALEAGAVVAAGSTTAGALPSYLLTWRTALGAANPSFGNAGTSAFGNTFRANGFARLGDGSLAVVGDVQQGQAAYTAGVAGVKGNALFARGFANALGASFFGVAAQDATRVVATGHTAVPNGEARVERFFAADGRKDPSFGDGGTAIVEPGGVANGFEVAFFAAAVQADGRILAAGNRSNAGAVIYRLWP